MQPDICTQGGRRNEPGALLAEALERYEQAGGDSALANAERRRRSFGLGAGIEDLVLRVGGIGLDERN